MRLEDTFLSALDTLDIPEGAFCVAALSGGSDSVALLCLARIAAEGGRIRLSAARVSHGIRPRETEERETEFCRRLCGRRDVPFAALGSSADPNRPLSVARRTGCGVENAARDYRHGLLEDHRSAIGAQFLLFGHTRDDDRETILLRVLSGSGPEGLKGIPDRRGPIRRPLLTLSRNDLRAYLQAADISWMEDASNGDERFTRNRVRHSLVPSLDRLFPGWTTAMTGLKERSAEASEALQTAAKQQLPMGTRENAVVWLKRDWDDASPYIRALSLWNGMNSLARDSQRGERISWSLIKEARQFVEADRPWHRDGYRLASSGKNVLLSLDEVAWETGCIITVRDIPGGFTPPGGSTEVVLDRVVGPADDTAAIHPEDWPLAMRWNSREGHGTVTIEAMGSERRWTLADGRFQESNPSGRITEKSSAAVRPDADNDIVYIRMRGTQEGSDARGQQ